MPSELHESRREQLDTMHILAGLVAPLHLEWSMQPDVARLDPLRPRLGIGDAKSTETPGNLGTQRRLIRYARGARNWWAAGWSVSLSLAVCPDDAEGWQISLERVWVIGGLPAMHGKALIVDPRLAIVTIEAASARGLDEGRGPNLVLNRAKTSQEPTQSDRSFLRRWGP